jgi:type III secretory pathway component EscR
MNKNSYDYETEPPARSSFLTVLCILTFIGSGWGILSSAWTFSTASETASIFKEPRQSNNESANIDSAQLNRSRARSAFEKKMKTSFSDLLTADHIRKSAIGTIVAALFTLLGALLMWRLKRIGFYLYIAGVLVALIFPFYLYNNNFLAAGMSAVSSFFGLIFIALYALNFKSLKSN